MERISDNAGTEKWVQYGKFQFLDVTAEVLKTVDSPADTNKFYDSSKCDTVDSSMGYIVDSSMEKRMETWKPAFTDAALERAPAMAGVWKNCKQQAEEAIGQFLDGEIDADALSQVFQRVYQSVTDAAQENGYPIPLWDAAMGPAALESIYSEFRRQILDVAVQRNNQEGRQYISGQLTAQRNWKYYNSDYYFKTEEAIGAITERYTSMAQEAGWEDWVSVPDYKEKGLNLYYNFNTAFSNQFSADEQFMLDPDQAPPEGFQWFYQSGGGDGRTGFVTSLTIHNPDGTETFIDYTSPGFQPTDPASGMSWASYLDENGERHQISTDFRFTFEASDLYNMASLLHFSGDSAAAQAANLFLQNLQVYPAGYFSRFPAQEMYLNMYA